MSIIFNTKTYDNYNDFLKELKEQVFINKNNKLILIKIINQLPEIVYKLSMDKSIIIKNNYINEIVNIFNKTVINKETIKQIIEHYNKEIEFTYDEININNTITEYISFFNKELYDNFVFIIDNTKKFINVFCNLFKSICKITIINFNTIINIFGYNLIKLSFCIINILLCGFKIIIPYIILIIGYLIKGIIYIIKNIINFTISLLKDNVFSIQENDLESYMNSKINYNRQECNNIYTKINFS